MMNNKSIKDMINIENEKLKICSLNPTFNRDGVLII